MDIFLPEHKKLLLLLVKNKVEFLLVGGYAVIIYGYERTTKDMDLWVKPNNLNKIKLIKTLKEYGIEDESIDLISSFNFEEPQILILGEKPMQTDFMTKIQGVEYEEAEKNKMLLTLTGQQIPVIHFKHLILNKMVCGRPQDVADVEILQEINRNRKNSESLK